MKYKLITAITGILLSFQLSAQQEANYSQYFFDPLTVNPAYAGSRGVFSGTLTYRNQWLGGIPGSPVTQALDAHMPIGDKIGVGLQLYNDQAGPLHIASATAIFTYSIHITQDTKLAFGLGAAFNSVGVNFSQITVDMPNDPAFPTNNMTAMVPDANFGMYLYKQNFYAGFSATHLIQSEWKLQSAPITTPTAMFYRQYYITGGYVGKLSDNLSLRPSLLVQFVQGAPALEELDATIIYKERFFIGLGIRNGFRRGISGSDDVLVPSIEYDLGNKFRIGYSYDIFLSSAGSYSTGTHEIMLGWDLNTTKTRMVNPRFF